MRLLEGRFYDFFYLEDVAFPDGSRKMKLKDPNHFIHFLDHKNFEKYNLTPGQTIKIHIDKINCTGEMFIEPEHPYYKPGEAYLFDIVDISKSISKSLIWLEDKFKNKVSIPLSKELENYRIGDLIKCRVEKIKSGKLLLFPLEHLSDIKHLEPGKTYQFDVIAEEIYADKHGFFLLEHKHGWRARIRRKYYAAYGLMPGRSVQCQLIKHKETCLLEPLHPGLREGGIYPFLISKKIFLEPYGKGKTPFLVLNNPYGKEIYMEAGQYNKSLQINDQVHCRVTKIFRGKIEVVLADKNL